MWQWGDSNHDIMTWNRIRTYYKIMRRISNMCNNPKILNKKIQFTIIKEQQKDPFHILDVENNSSPNYILWQWHIFELLTWGISLINKFWIYNKLKCHTIN